ncbi:MAG: hypothetical protein M1415_05670, partial [Firmicutes bacterium]|nr:hypothetical protein [Bacillota bacterium]
LPRHKRLSRPSRLQAAKHWIAQYSGTHILRSYRKHFAVDFECALKELTQLGSRFEPEYVAQYRHSLHGQHDHRRIRRAAQVHHAEDRGEELAWLLEAMGVEAYGYEEQSYGKQ